VLRGIEGSIQPNYFDRQYGYAQKVWQINQSRLPEDSL